MVLRRIGFIVFFFYFFSPGVDGLCKRTECKCVPYRHNSLFAECAFQSRQMMAMKASDFPSELGAVVMSGGRELRFDIEVFSHLTHLESVVVRGVPKVYVKEHSFANMSSKTPVSFEFSDAQFLIFEGMSWKSPDGPVSVLVARVNRAIIHGQAFSRLTNFTAVDVGRLELLEKAFYIARPYNANNTTISLERVHIENLAKMTFQSSVYEVRLSGSEVKKVSTDAFTALQIERVIIENSTLHRVEAAAFSDQTLIQTMTLRQARLHDVEGAAFLSGLSNLVIIHSKLGIVRSGAMNITVATVLMADNMFSHVHSHGIVLKDWNTLTISNNTFKRVEREAFTSPSAPPAASRPGGPAEDYLVVTEEPAKTHEFNFTRNIIVEVHDSAFDFGVNDDSKVLIDNNFFIFNCHCNMDNVGLLISGGKAAMFDTGLCSVDETLSKCFQLPMGFVNMYNFTENVCKVHGSIVCEEVQRDAEDAPDEPSITSAVDIPYDDVEREKQILTSLFAIILVGMLVVMIVSAMMWVGRKGYCAKARRFLLPSTNSLVDHLTRMFSSSGVTPAVSVSRLSVHEYAELQRKMEEAKNLEEDDGTLEDKATQTLPEELTQELLQSLKEKLNDPENYSEARDMIEHLYDLIKVEENCNKNYRDSTCVTIEEPEHGDNLYDVIRPKRPPQSRTGKPELVSQGTRAPSPDKLLPYSKKPTIVSDYMEPRDRKVHTYSEIPPRPDLLPGPHVSTSVSMANRPLPAEPTQL
ncbi:hypothetical protein GE061_005117 [Apolygus lucorum]|uniref:Right handed beta helix domain-containing protein n=2 Tax=Apolygus lucorum TaxID=248454 RepID=A0A8S9WWR9_APOLU|nr:hypothetical protein GE061_005117 [Apolygus lucorum]